MTIHWTIYPGSIDSFRNSYMPELHITTDTEEEAQELRKRLDVMQVQGHLTYSVK